MSLTAGIILALSILAAVEGGAIGLQVRAHRREQAESAAALATEQDARRVEVAALTGELEACRVRVTPESLHEAARGTTDALSAALAPELLEVQARAGLVLALPRAEVTHELLEVASPQMIAALERLLSCDAADAAGVKKPLGCDPTGPYVDAWSRAVEALPACPAPSEGQAPE